MKKKLFYSAILSAIIATAFLSFSNKNNNLQKDNFSDIFIANVEALANGESGVQPMDCYSRVENTNDGKPAETQTYCGDCKPIKCTHWSNSDRCTR